MPHIRKLAVSAQDAIRASRPELRDYDLVATFGAVWLGRSGDDNYFYVWGDDDPVLLDTLPGTYVCDTADQLHHMVKPNLLRARVQDNATGDTTLLLMRDVPADPAAEGLTVLETNVFPISFA